MQQGNFVDRRYAPFGSVNSMNTEDRTLASAELSRMALSQSMLAGLENLTEDNDKIWLTINETTDIYDGNPETMGSILLGVVHLSGQSPLGYTEGHGNLVRDVKPVLGREHENTTAGAKNLVAHCDHGWARYSFEKDDSRPVQPCSVWLACIENECDIGTIIWSNRAIEQRLSTSAKRGLQSYEFSFFAPDSIKPRKVAHDAPILVYGRDEAPHIRLTEKIVCHTVEAKNALNELRDILEDKSLQNEIILKPGEVLAFDSTRTIHARNRVEGRRWLKALYGRKVNVDGRVVSPRLRFYETV